MLHIILYGGGPLVRSLPPFLQGMGHKTASAANLTELKRLLSQKRPLDLLVLGDEDTGGMAWTPRPGTEDALRRIEAAYRQMAVDPLMAVYEALPALRQGGLKRIAYLTDRSSSSSTCKDALGYPLRLSGAARNMQANLLKNQLEREGFTFRVFACSEEISPEETAAAAAYLLEDRSLDPDSERHTDERRLVMRDAHGREIPW